MEQVVAQVGDGWFIVGVVLIFLGLNWIIPGNGGGGANEDHNQAAGCMDSSHKT